MPIRSHAGRHPQVKAALLPVLLNALIRTASEFTVRRILDFSLVIYGSYLGLDLHQNGLNTKAGTVNVPNYVSNSAAHPLRCLLT